MMNAYFWWNLWILAGVVCIGAVVAVCAHKVRKRREQRPGQRRTER